MEADAATEPTSPPKQLLEMEAAGNSEKTTIPTAAEIEAAAAAGGEEVSEADTATEPSANPVAMVDASIKYGVNTVKDFFKSPDQKESNKIFHELDTDNSNMASKEEMSKFVASNDRLWAMISVNLNQPPELAQKAATQVAMELATGLKGNEALEAELTKDQFFKFRMAYIKDPAGSQEFFQRAIFASFDTDNNAMLDQEELAQFLEIFYQSGSIFKGDLRLPPKQVLEKILLERFDTDGQGTLSFDTIRGIISGQMEADMKEELAEAAAKAEEEERLRKEAEEKARKEAEEKARKEAEEKARKEAEEKARKEAEEKARKEAEEAAAKRAEEERLAAEAEAAKKAEEEKVAAAKKAEEEAAAAKIKVEEEAAAKKKKAEEEEAAAAKKNAEQGAKKEEEDGCVFCEWIESLFKSEPTKQAA